MFNQNVFSNVSNVLAQIKSASFNIVLIVKLNINYECKGHFLHFIIKKKIKDRKKEQYLLAMILMKNVSDGYEWHQVGKSPR